MHPLNHLKIHPPSILRLVIVLTCACLVSPPLPLFAEELIMVSPAVGADEVADFAAALAAEGKSPTPNDDLVINGKFSFPSGTNIELTVGNLTLRRTGTLFLGMDGLTTVRDNISIQSGELAVQAGSLKWGGMLEIGNEGEKSVSRFETLINFSKVEGHSMTVPPPN